MSPMGFAVHRQARLQADDDSMYGDDGDYAFDLPARLKPVPIWLCVFLVVSYIIAGAFLFSNWEGWSFLDSAYFCFITLTTIGTIFLYNTFHIIRFDIDFIFHLLLHVFIVYVFYFKVLEILCRPKALRIIQRCPLHFVHFIYCLALHCWP